MAGVRHMVGVPWHIEILRRNYSDPPRSVSKCIHYKRDGKDGHCKCRALKCLGSTHCDYYEERKQGDSKTNVRKIGKKSYINKKTSLKNVRLSNNAGKTSEDNVYWYTRTIGDIKID